ncbi:MAG: MBL fold metallo-hydrolase [Solirubrobacteraceae bacterium]|jgi:glyoxylase-like metal-dependent hydrolase (beta-lactamase superfamily II)/rhodanese-related sulfurtransferase
MFFCQIVHEDLGCASYVVASEGVAAVVDPKWEIDDYLDAATRAGAEIRHVLETHFHADHVSGRERLVAATGATAHVPSDPSRPDGPGLRDEDTVEVGALTLRVIATPGHRPEHLSYLVTEPGSASGRSVLLGGDSLLIGELARPDLAVDAKDGASALFDTVKRLTALGDAVQLWPGHVGASLCGGGALSERTSSTIGDERRSSALIAIDDRDAFVRELTRSVPARPPRVAQVVALNVQGARDPGPVRELEPGGLGTFIAGGACVIDVRDPDEFDHGHIAGALNLPAAGQSIGTRAGWATAPDEPVVIVATTLCRAMRVARLLYAAGVWSIAGVSAADRGGWLASGLTVHSTRALETEQLAALLSDVQLVDVRDQAEWRAGHVSGSVHLPLHRLQNGDSETLGDRRPLAVACAGGRRAALAASVLRRQGHGDVARVRGGIGELAGYGVSLVGDGR